MSLVIDTNVALYLLAGRLEEPLPAGQPFISVITELELLAYPGIERSEEERIRQFLAAVQIIDLGAEVKAAAIRLRREKRLKLPDAIVAGTAMALDALLITNDARLSALDGVRAQTLRVKAP